MSGYTSSWVKGRRDLMYVLSYSVLLNSLVIGGCSGSGSSWKPAAASSLTEEMMPNMLIYMSSAASCERVI